MDKLFVYGTLAPGQPNEHILKKIGGNWEKGFVWGRLSSEGWGTELGSPGIRLDDKSEKIEGYLFSSDHLKDHWSALDDFEGSEYRRVKSKINLENGGEEVEAFIYVLK